MSNSSLTTEAVARIDNAFKTFGFNLLHCSSDKCDLSLTITDDMTNPLGRCHGGFIFALADAAFGYASSIEPPPTVAQHCSISYLKAVNVGDVITARARLLSAAGRSHLYYVVVRNQDDEVVAAMHGAAREVPHGLSLRELMERNQESSLPKLSKTLFNLSLIFPLTFSINYIHEGRRRLHIPPESL